MDDKELFGISEQLESSHFADPGKMVGDLISRQAAIDAMMKLQTEDIEAYGASIPEGFDGDRAVTALKALPSAQQEIVACGDCIHWIYHDRRCGYWNHGVKPLDWCCHAERRTNG